MLKSQTCSLSDCHTQLSRSFTCPATPHAPPLSHSPQVLLLSFFHQQHQNVHQNGPPPLKCAAASCLSKWRRVKKGSVWEDLLPITPAESRFSFSFFFHPPYFSLSLVPTEKMEQKKTTPKKASLQELETFVGRQCQLCYSANGDNVSGVGVKGDLAVRRWLNEELSEPRAHSEVSLTL